MGHIKVLNQYELLPKACSLYSFRSTVMLTCTVYKYSAVLISICTAAHKPLNFDALLSLDSYSVYYLD